MVKLKQSCSEGGVNYIVSLSWSFYFLLRENKALIYSVYSIGGQGDREMFSVLRQRERALVCMKVIAKQSLVKHKRKKNPIAWGIL